MSIAPVGFADIKAAADKTSRPRKSLEAVAFLAPYGTPLVDVLTDATGAVKALPEAYLPVGMVGVDAYNFGGDTDTAEVEAHGYGPPVRTDITKVSRDISFPALNVYHRNLLEVAYGMDLSEVTQAENGEIKFSRPPVPLKRYYRLFVISKDGSGADEIYRAKLHPRVSIKEIPEEAWNAQDPKQFELTFGAEVDPAVGTNEIEFIAGPGAKTQELGFKPAAP